MSNDTIVLCNKQYDLSGTDQAVNKARRPESVKKLSTAINKNMQPVQEVLKLDKETETLKHHKIPLDVAKLIAQHRLAKGLRQKDLATKICEKTQVINDYEAGRAIPNNAILTKIERALGVKLRGKDRGQPINNKADKISKN